jgi:Dyp-type peroxidase family
MRPQLVEQRDLQGNVLAGYGFDHALFIFLRVTDPGMGRQWLGQLAEGDQITTAVRLEEQFDDLETAVTLNLAFTHQGLRSLGTSETVLRGFPTDYRQGMGGRAELLGDDGASAPARWELGLRPGDADALITLTAQDTDRLAGWRATIEERAADEHSGAHVVHTVSTSVLRDPETGTVAREHFGFADGLAQPSIAGRASHDPRRRVGPKRRRGQGTPRLPGLNRLPTSNRVPRWKPLAPGEFVLGYRDEAGVVAGVRGDRPLEPFLKNGSYMVVRKLRQDVALFNRFLLDAAGGDGAEAELLAAKIMGRWRDGTPLVSSPDRPAPRRRGASAEPDNDFAYAGDPDGYRCPLGSHVRRANPRDSLGFRGRLASRHRIIRRGMPYGPPPADPLVEDGLERGLMFVCYQASIQRQFEVIQGRWLSDGDAFGLGHDRDFLLGGGDPGGKMVIQGRPPRILSPRRSFVVNRGGGYFFAPGIEALRALVRGT